MSQGVQGLQRSLKMFRTKGSLKKKSAMEMQRIVLIFSYLLQIAEGIRVGWE